MSKKKRPRHYKVANKNVDKYLTQIVSATINTIQDAIIDEDTDFYNRHPTDIILLVVSNLTINLMAILIKPQLSPRLRLSAIEDYLVDFNETVLEMWKVLEASMVDNSNPQ